MPQSPSGRHRPACALAALTGKNTTAANKVGRSTARAGDAALPERHRLLADTSPCVYVACHGMHDGLTLLGVFACIELAQIAVKSIARASNRRRNRMRCKHEGRLQRRLMTIDKWDNARGIVSGWCDDYNWWFVQRMPVRGAPRVIAERRIVEGQHV